MLQILSGEREGSEIEFQDDEIFVGKDDSCTIKLADAGVSRKHARIAKKGEGWTIEDLGSSNGTWVNFKKRGTNEAADIVDRDIVFIGRTVTKFWLTAPPSRGGSGGGGGGVSETELRDLLRSVVPVQGLACPSCRTDLEPELRSRIREQEQVELIRRTRLHELDPASLDRLLSQARR
jgi:pSer/pThr/pTyr-binding forkhead associated (FHA) protein